MNANYLSQLKAARAETNQQGTKDISSAMADIRQYSEQLKDLDTQEIKEINELMDKVDGVSDMFAKYAKLQEKMEAFKANAALLETSLSKFEETVKEENIEPFTGYTQDETYAINLQLIKEFETESRLSKDLLKLSETQPLEAEVPDEVPAYDGLTKEQTVQVYMQVMAEFEAQTDLSKKLAYNAGV